MTEFEQIVNRLYEQYKNRGYITEDEVLDSDCSFDVLSAVTERLLDLGVIIKEEKPEAEEEYDASRIDYNEILDKILAQHPELKTFIKYVRKIQSPQWKEWQSLLPQVESGNKWAKERLFGMYLRVVLKQAWYSHCEYGVSLLDAIQDGCYGLLYAISAFDRTENNSFLSYLTLAITGHIRRSADVPYYQFITTPVHIKDNLYKIYSLYENHFCPECMCKRRKNECETLKDEIMVALDCSLAEAKEYLNLLTPYYNEIYELFDDEQETPFDLEARANLKKVVVRLLSELSQTEEIVLRARYGFIDDMPLSLEDTGKLIGGVTRERVRQIEQVALNKLKHPTRARQLRSFLEDSRYGFWSKRVAETQSSDDNRIEKKKRGRKPKEVVESYVGTTRWNPGDVSKMIRLVKQGLSCSQIGVRIRKSKSAVIGKLRRLGIKVTNED